MNNTNTIDAPAATLTTHIVPAQGPFGVQTLFEMHAGGLTSGWCCNAGEAMARIRTLLAGGTPETSMPDYQASIAEMQSAAKWLETVAIRDGGQCHNAIKAALVAGPHTTEWAHASRYLAAGWVQF